MLSVEISRTPDRGGSARWIEFTGIQLADSASGFTEIVVTGDTRNRRVPAVWLHQAIHTGHEGVLYELLGAGV